MDGREVKQIVQNARGTGDLSGELRGLDVLETGQGRESEGRGLEGYGLEGSGLEGGESVVSAEERTRVRGLGGLAVGQVLTYNPEVLAQPEALIQPEAGPTRSEVGMLESGMVQGRGADRMVQGRDTSEMMGVDGENLQQLEHLSEWMKMQNERVREQVELENGYARKEIAPNLSSVGLESKVERAEYRAADLANAEGELKPNTFEDEIQNKGQEEVGKAAAIEAGKLLKQKSFRPNDVVEWRDKGMLQMFERFKEKRVFKGRNG